MVRGEGVMRGNWKERKDKKRGDDYRRKKGSGGII